MLGLYGYMDEAGDAGTGKGKRYFTICSFVISDKAKCHELLKKQRVEYKEFFGHGFFKEIKTHNLSSDKENVFFLNGLNKLEYIAYVGHLDTYNTKNNLNRYEPIEKKMIMTRTLLMHILGAHPNINQIILDNGLLNDQQLDLLKDELKENNLPVPSIKSHRSETVAGLAYADLIANAIRRYCAGDNMLYSIINKNVKLIEL